MRKAVSFPCFCPTRLAYVSEVEALFWNQFNVKDFHTLVPTNKWQVPQRNKANGGCGAHHVHFQVQ